MTVQPKNFDVRALAQAAMTALRKGDANTACDAFEKIIASGLADASIFLGLAYAHRLSRDHVSALAAADRALALEPAHLRAMIFKADTYAEQGDRRAAAAFYSAVLRAAPQPQQLPADLRSEVERASAMCERYTNALEDDLQKLFADKGLNPAKTSPRFAQSLDILFGRKQRYVQAPRYYLFPELPHRQFFAREEFPWIAQLEQATDAIRRELLEVLKDQGAFKPYVQGDPNRPYNPQDGMLNNPDWSAFYLWKDGEIVAGNAARCPETMKALKHVPLTRAQHRSPSVLFSLLRPGAHIPPHSGLINTRLIGHLPLIVPPGCTFRVGNEIREWVEGKAWLFDDTIEHEAWNRSDQTRVVLIFEIWRPELTEDERRLVCTMFEAIDSHAGTKPRWEI